MNKKIILIPFFVLVILSVIFISNKKMNIMYKNIESTEKVVDASDLPIKIEDIEYEIETSQNDEGEILMYLKAKNNSQRDLLALSVIIVDENKKESVIEYLQKIKAQQTTDNYTSIKNSKDDRTKTPIKGSDGEYLHEIGKIQIKSIVYKFNDKGIKKRVEYNLQNKQYTIEDY